jgi:hypothetical protein
MWSGMYPYEVSHKVLWEGTIVFTILSNLSLRIMNPFDFSFFFLDDSSNIYKSSHIVSFYHLPSKQEILDPPKTGDRRSKTCRLSWLEQVRELEMTFSVLLFDFPTLYIDKLNVQKRHWVSKTYRISICQSLNMTLEGWLHRPGFHLIQESINISE